MQLSILQFLKDFDADDKYNDSDVICAVAVRICDILSEKLY